MWQLDGLAKKKRTSPIPATISVRTASLSIKDCHRCGLVIVVSAEPVVSADAEVSFADCEAARIFENARAASSTAFPVCACRALRRARLNSDLKDDRTHMLWRSGWIGSGLRDIARVCGSARSRFRWIVRSQRSSLRCRTDSIRRSNDDLTVATSFIHI